ncbi:trihelix transcription factor ASIL1-like [Chenopodium quinoa]|uniref:trihelix transcription factor ASIL1-like n=1 Tax=Chenopodium quinoa TaxID=63459 RepID=UPI000B771F8D|nr:trihelix transcription factor ASIL1-like [Chenopodium quinoa]
MSSSPQPQPQSPPRHSPPQQSPPPSPPTTTTITTTTTSTPTPQPQPQPPPIIQALSYSPLKKPQPIPWSHEETLNLIKAYQEKWYSLKRGQLKASQWEEVAITVAARCGLDDPSKSGTQCRHKIEKLRKRYRAEKQKMGPNYNYHNHPWIYFSLMDQLERGPLPISAIAPADDCINNNNNNSTNHYDDDDDEDEEGRGVRFASMEKLRRDRVGAMGRGFGNGYRSGCMRSLRDLKKRKSYWEGDDDEEEEVGFEDGGEEVGGVEERENGRNLMGELGAQMRGFAENFIRIERKKLDLMRDNQRLRIEMESKKREMIVVYQHKTIELINKAFTDAAASASSSEKKMKMMSPDL